jgi:hypothetical protein
MSASTIVYALLVAIAGAAAIIIVPNIPFYFGRRRLMRRFAQLQCEACKKPFGLEAVRSGKNVSPFEELWSDGKDHHIHHHPICRLVLCPHCHHAWVLRHNRQGEKFGPEISIHEPKAA